MLYSRRYCAIKSDNHTAGIIVTTAAVEAASRITSAPTSSCPVDAPVPQLRVSRGWNCSWGAERCWHRCASRKDRTPLEKNVRKLLRLKSAASWSAESQQLLHRSAEGSSSSILRETADGGTSFDSSSESPTAVPEASEFAISSEGSGAFCQSNTVGILGGLAPLATVDFMRKILDATNAEDESDHIPVLLCSDPNIRKKIVPSLRAAKSNPARDANESDMMVSVAPLLQKRRFLEKAGAKCIVMPCHVSHLWYDQLVEGCSVPFLHMADCVVEELKAAKLQPLEAGSRPKIGVLGSEATLASAFYQERLRSEGFDVVLPDKATMEHAVIPGIAALQRRDMEGARNLLRIAVQVLLVNAVNVVVLACHNMPTAFSVDDPVLRKCIDPTDSLARATVRWSQAMKVIR